MTVDPPTVALVVREQAQSRAEHPLLVCDAESLSYAGAERRSAALARGLVALGAGKGTHVGLLYPNGPDFVIGTLAAARIGAVVVPFTTFAAARELGEQLADADVSILLASRTYRSHDFARRLGDALGVEAFDVVQRVFSSAAPQLRHVAFEQPGVARIGDAVDETLLRALEDDVDGSDPFAIIYTSGSTGAPKGAVHTHAALLTHQQNLNAIRGLAAEDRLFCNSPFFWVGGFAFGLLATLVAGSTLVCSNAVDAGETLDLIEAQRPTMTNGFAATIARLARHDSFGRRDLSSMRRGNLYPMMPPDAQPADPELRHNMLGMTEAGSTLLISADESDQPEDRRGSYGRPAPGFETRIVDPGTGEPVTPGAVGELHLRGPLVMQRYHRRSREECFDPDGWFHTGDLVCADLDGFMYFIGRRTSMIKTSGANVSPAEVEKVIARVTGGTVAHVVGIPDPDRGEVVAAVIVVDGVTGGPFDENALRALLGPELSAYKVPRRFVALPAAEVPVLPSGKVDLGGLRKVFDD
ncbi:MAG TPA: class I adenylate-forming enzyme family protein [Mycobacterium sp.]|nr:class I adenylate-forming enzyme family protein [Mycobacterium sp.]